MNLCLCGCNTLVRHRWKRGHQFRAGRGNAQLDATVVGEIAKALDDPPFVPPDEPLPAAPPNGPPPYPGRIDRMRWRIAAERPGTPPTNPWVETKCHECLGKMWTRDPMSTWEHGGLCDECDYILRSEVQTNNNRRFSLQAHTIWDPFRPRT